jgi:cytochrome b561
VIAEAAIGLEIVAFARKSGRRRHSSGPMKVFPPPRVVAVYNPVLRAVHWLMAILIFAALALGVWAIQLPRSDFRSEVLFVHKSIGVTVFALVILRIVVRLIVGAPAYARPLGRLVHAAASSGNLALYALMIAMPVSGYLASAAGGHEISFFGLFDLPNLVARNKALDEAAGQAHYVFAWLLGVTLVLHLAAVVWHARVRRDEVLTRMWPRFRPAPVPR